MSDILKSDHGKMNEYAAGASPAIGWLVVGRLGNIKVLGPAITMWLQLRGSSMMETRDGGVRLIARDWLVLERDAAPRLQAQRNGLAIGLVIPVGGCDRWAAFHEHCPFTGHARMTLSECRMALRLWRQSVRFADASEQGRRCLQILLMHLRSLQPEASALLVRCPGRSQMHKRNLLGRLQRARLFLESNSHRVVRLPELAELTNLSPWYLSKTFHSVYRETVQSTGVRTRLARACHLLETTVLSISEISELCGFENCCSFSRLFRVRFGMTASDYRRTAAGSSHDWKVGFQNPSARLSAGNGGRIAMPA